MKPYHSPRSRSVRVRWLLEELGVPYELVQRAYKPPALPFAQDSPMGKFPALEDGPVVMIESGAIVEYLLEQYGAGRLGPRAGEPQGQLVGFAAGVEHRPGGAVPAGPGTSRPRQVGHDRDRSGRGPGRVW